jgi:hypothetical protein
MGLDELHARRLATVMTMVENSLDRIEMLVGSRPTGKAESGSACVAGNSRELRSERERTAVPPSESASKSQWSAEQVREIRQASARIRRRLLQAVERFSIRPHKPDPRQTLGAEMAALWVILENAWPKRMKGYGREFDPADKAAWEALVQDLLRQVEELQKVATRPPDSGAE